jgi:hypothetical protein
VAYDPQEELWPREGLLDWDPVQAGADVGDNLRRRGRWSFRRPAVAKLDDIVRQGVEPQQRGLDPAPDIGGHEELPSSAASAATGKQNCRKEAAKAIQHTSGIGRVVYG